MAKVVHDGAGVHAGGVYEGGTETVLGTATLADGVADGVITLEAVIELGERLGVEAGAAKDGDVEGNAAGLLDGDAAGLLEGEAAGLLEGEATGLLAGGAAGLLAGGGEPDIAS